MIYKEEVRDLFLVPEDYYLAHCISADFGMGKGIVVEFNKRYDMKNRLTKKYPNYLAKWQREGYLGDCILEGNTFNLITKERYWNKPTYDSLETSLISMGLICVQKGIKKVAMPTIGAGLDRLDFEKVKEIIFEVFKNVDIEILVCKLK